MLKKQSQRKVGGVVLMLAVLLGVSGMASAAERRPDAFRNFITRQGNKLIDGNKEFRFMGANMPGLVLPYDWTLYLPERLTLPTAWEQEDAFKTLDQMNLRVVRLWNLPMRKYKETAKPYNYIVNPGEFNEEAFKTLDNVLALAHKYNVRVMIDFSAEYGSYLGGIEDYAGYRGKKKTDFYKDPQIKEDYKATVRHVIGRVNSITGIPYREDKAILAWQFGNEMHSATAEWLSEMAAYIKSLDRNHLVAETRHRPGQPLDIDPNIDMYTRHLYANYAGVSDGWVGAIEAEMAKLKGERPMFIGEYGPYIDNKMFTHENVASKHREFLDYVIKQDGMAGALIWSMYFHHQNGGFYWHQIMTYPAVWSYHWPGFPSADAQREQEIMGTLREKAFAIQKLPVPPLPVPDAPQLLPIGEVPMFSWRGSAGATGYDVERAVQANGPWTVVGSNVCDGDVAYRPLFSDTIARAGQTWFYRVKARNSSGVSQASNVVGPVAVKRVCMADELQDFSRVQSRSQGLKPDNDYNALYAEFLFRVQGVAGEYLTYQVPAAMESVKVTAFYAKDLTDITLKVSADNVTFTDLKPQRKDRQLPSPPGGATKGQRRTMVEYECAVPAGNRYLKVVWNGPAELDRVEIYHPGAK